MKKQHEFVSFLGNFFYFCKYNKNYYRLLAFWDKTDNKETLVVCAHGFIKKTKKTPKSDIEKAKLIMKKYFENGNK